MSRSGGAVLLAVVAAFGACDALRYFGPEETEREAMDERSDRREEAGADASIAVHPVRRHDRVDPEAAVELAALLEENDFGDTRALEDGPWFELRPSMNEQSPLGELARKFREHVRANPPDEDYAREVRAGVSLAELEQVVRLRAIADRGSPRRRTRVRLRGRLGDGRGVDAGSRDG